ncbi:MAG: filamentous hemagglutinin N-terminal domain-containing protein [Nostoc sp.]|uniref:two-partner secretion domain-containing protein n=1 Tax=Nostoc sp. TaxID=1180 RepID=UPI002FFBDF46
MSRMKRYRQHWCWKFALGSWLVMGSAIGEAVLQTFAFSFNCAFAQITPDSTLPNNSSVTTQDNISTIEGGTQAGSNLFHSFQQFSVPTGSTAYFNNAVDIQNIISQVTGKSISNIDGLIRANGTANLFLINPNGIIFGRNAQLNIGGSFLASTASSLKFADGTLFSATAYLTTPLLTVSVPIGLQYEGAASGMLVQGAGLAVQPGKTLALVGGDVNLNGGILFAPGGRVDLGGLAGEGTVGLNFTGNNLTLYFPEGVARTDVSLTNGTNVNVRAGGSGSIAINAENLKLEGTSGLLAGINSGLGSIGSVAEDIEINAIATINLTSGSFIENDVLPRAVGKGGGIKITAGSLFVTNGAQLGAGTSGQGNAGSVNINARDTVSFDGVSAYSTVESQGVGKGGNINITAGSLFVTNGAQLQSLSRGQGDAGSVNINARDTVSFDGVGSSDRLPSGAFSTMENEAVGNGGDINIMTGALSVANGAQLQSLTQGRGDAGSVNINARDTVSFDGKSAAFSSVENEAVGNGGDINITTGVLSVTNGAQLAASTSRQGDAGNVNINARDTVSFDGKSAAFSSVENEAVGNGGDINITTGALSVTNGAQLLSSTGIFSQGNAGNVNINARDTVSFDGGDASSRLGILSVGKGGNINITTESLSVKNGAQLAATTRGEGNAGSVNINARDTVSFDGVRSDGRSSAAFSSVEAPAAGNGGDINITTRLLYVKNGAFLTASTRGRGDGGNITVNANTLEAVNGGQILTTSRTSGKAGNITLNVTDRLTLSGSDRTYSNRFAQLGWLAEQVSDAGAFSGLFANTLEDSTGQGGDLKITTGQLAVRDGAEVTVSSEGTGNAGSLRVQADSIKLDTQGKLQASTASGKGGNINLQVRDLILMRRNSLISAEASNNGNGGNIKINAPFIVAVPKEDSNIVANAFRGRGGNINITTSGIYGLEYRLSLTNFSDINASSQFGVNGTVQINTPDIDPNSGNINLPTIPIDTQVAQTCQAGGNLVKSSFTITGRGGLPPNPGEALSADAVQVDLVTLNPKVGNPPAVSTNPIKPTPDRIVEATGWVIAANGDVILTSSAPITPHSSWQNPADCRVLNQHQRG